jgi:hypothetical protein
VWGWWCWVWGCTGPDSLARFVVAVPIQYDRASISRKKTNLQADNCCPCIFQTLDTSMSNSTTSVSEQIEQRALAAVESHPLQKEAVGWPHCVSDVYETSKEFVERMTLSKEDKTPIQSALADVETVLMVSYWTSERKPEPLSGGGKHYAFLVHPQSFAVLLSHVGTWRS